jgi:acyl carrier protein
MDRRGLEDWLVTRVAALVGLPEAEIDPVAPLQSFGVTSLMAVELAADLEDLTGVTVDATIAWEYPTIEKLARRLAGQTSAAG